MHKNSGVTLIALAVTIFIIGVLAGVTINATNVGYNTAKTLAFVEKMNLIQEQVNIANVKKVNGDETIENYGTEIPETEVDNLKQILGKEDISGFRYFTPDDLSKYLNLEGIDETVFINFDTRQIYSASGIKYNGEMHYSQYDLPNGQYNIGYSPNSTKRIAKSTKSKSNIDINIDKLNFGLYATLKIQNAEQFSGGTFFYGIREADNIATWNKLNNDYVNVTQTGNYVIKYVDDLGNETAQDVDVVLVNSPVLTEGMIPVVYDENERQWVQVSEKDGKWYDYSENKWANVMLKDGSISKESASMFVWIPRFAYSITSNFSSNVAGTIDIKFLQGTSNMPTDKSNVQIENTPGLRKWVYHSAFKNASSYGYNNYSGWFEEIPGMWVAKFEASADTSDKYIKVIPNAKGWIGLSEEEMFNKCLNMNSIANIYGLPKNAITHQMKNCEWGAVSYLAYSRFGKNEELTVNNNMARYTGNGYIGGGLTGSTTGNVYGVYDMSGGSRERVAAYIKNGENINAISTAMGDKKYLIDIYEDGYSSCSSRFGDAIYETSSMGSGANSWNGDTSNYPTLEDPFFSRGGLYSENTLAGIFAFSTGAKGEENDEYGFRPVIIISNK